MLFFKLMVVGLYCRRKDSLGLYTLNQRSAAGYRASLKYQYTKFASLVTRG
jgi:hypothetical protein